MLLLILINLLMRNSQLLFKTINLLKPLLLPAVFDLIWKINNVILQLFHVLFNRIRSRYETITNIKRRPYLLLKHLVFILYKNCIFHYLLSLSLNLILLSLHSKNLCLLRIISWLSRSWNLAYNLFIFDHITIHLLHLLSNLFFSQFKVTSLILNYLKILFNTLHMKNNVSVRNIHILRTHKQLPMLPNLLQYTFNKVKFDLRVYIEHYFLHVLLKFLHIFNRSGIIQFLINSPKQLLVKPLVVLIKTSSHILRNK